MTGEGIASDLEPLDPDMHVASLFVPAARRPSVVALFLFVLELERIATQVSEPMVAQIRYAWWREQVDAIYAGRPVAAPVALKLREAVVAHGLPRGPLDVMIDAHSLDCDQAPFADMAAFEAYCRDTQGSLMRLVARVLGAGDAADPVCDEAGLALGAALQLRAFDFWRRHRRLRLPLDLFLRAGVGEEDVFAGQADRPVAQGLAVVQQRIREALKAVNRSRFPRAAMPALAMATLARPVMAPGFDLRAPREPTRFARVALLALSNLLWRV
jgi:phytoene synthase